MEPEGYDFPCSAWFRGIDIDMPGDRRKPIERDEPADEKWFARLHGEEELSESPTKADIERLWQYVVQIRREVGQMKQLDTSPASISSKYKDEA